MQISVYLGALIFVILLSSEVVAVELSSGIDEQAQLPYWQISDQGIALRLVQRLPIQTRAFFLARGFKHEQAERIAQSCVFQTVFKNISHQTEHPSTLTYNLHDWIVIHNGKQLGMKTREDWAREWRSENVAIPVQLAFEWALYPTQQQYEPGDYNWGMSIFNLKPGSKFDLKIVWRQFGEIKTAVITDMQCAADINPQPNDEESK
jgi:hypothetical protein